MADRAYMRCPFCRNAGNQNPPEMMRDNVDFFCMMGHRGPHGMVMSMDPEMIKKEVFFKPGTNDIKAEIWVNSEVLIKAKEALGERFHPTIASLIRCCMAGDPVIVDGQQAAELRKLGVKNGSDMVATAKLNAELSGQNENLTEQVNKWETRFANALASTQ